MKQAYLKYITSLLLFGSNGIVASHIKLTSYEIVLLRSGLGGILLAILFFLSQKRVTALQYKKDLLYIALSGIAMAADWLLLFEAYAQIGVSLGMLINYCGPAIVVALSAVVFRERITWPKLVALMSALLGVFLISGQSVLEGISIWGLLCAGLSAVSYAAMVIFNKMSKQVTGMENATLQLLFALATVAVFVSCKQGFHIEIASSDLPWILMLGLLNTGIGCYCYFSSIGDLPVQSVAICGYLEPLSAVLLSAVFLGESMRPLQILGAGFIIGGALCGEIIKGSE